MEWSGPSAWGTMTWALYAVGALYFVGVLVYYMRFRAAERAVQAEEPGAVERYNRLVRGFPNAFYAKMFGRRRLE